MTPPLTDAQATKLLAMLDESPRLSKLTARALVFEVLGRDCAGDPHVIELMDRVFPGWETEYSEGELEGRV